MYLHRTGYRDDLVIWYHKGIFKKRDRISSFVTYSVPFHEEDDLAMEFLPGGDQWVGKLSMLPSPPCL